MRRSRIGMVTLLLAICVAPHALAKKKDEPQEPYLFLPRQFTTDAGAVPACTPLHVSISDPEEGVTLEDPNEVWGRVSVASKEWAELTKCQSLRDCLSAATEYKGRYTEEQLVTFSKGRLEAGMPVEFALMVLGPPDQAPAYMSMLNPMTGKPMSYHTYTWLRLNRKLSGLHTFLSVLGSFALGVAGVSGNLGTIDKALDVATVAGTADTITWEISGFPSARVVTVQATEDKKINMLMAN